MKGRMGIRHISSAEIGNLTPVFLPRLSTKDNTFPMVEYESDDNRPFFLKFLPAIGSLILFI